MGKGYQSSVYRNKPPASPVQLRERMISFTSPFELLKNKGTDRRRDLPKIMEKRNVVYQKTLKKWKAIKTERSNQMKKHESTAPGSRKIQPKPGMGQKAPPKNTMENRSQLQPKERTEPKEKPQPKPKTDALEKKDLKKPATQPPNKKKDGPQTP